MEETSSKGTRKTVLKLLAIAVSLAAVSTGGWFYYNSRLQGVPPPPGRVPQAIRPMARIMVVPQPSATAGTVPPSEPSPPPNNVPKRPIFHVLEQSHLDDFRDDLKQKVLDELAPTFPELQTALKDRVESSGKPPYQRVAFELLEAAEKASADRRPAILFAADLVASHLGCDRNEARDEAKGDCARLRSDLARYNLTLANDELGGGPYYPHDLLWRIWGDYPETEWGERAFVLLLDSGWDTSVTCQEGGDRTREVIRQGNPSCKSGPAAPTEGSSRCLWPRRMLRGGR
jgi:hypothetical protein